MRIVKGCRKVIGLVLLGTVLAIVLAIIAVGGSGSKANPTAVSQTLSRTPAAIASKTPQPTGIRTIIPGSDAARIDIGKTLTVPLKAAYLQIAGVKSVNVSIIPTKQEKQYIVAGDAVIESGTDMLTVADAMRNTAYQVLTSAFVEFSIILYDGKNAVSYDWDNKTDQWRTGAMPTPVR
jgi:hypothetical protein